MVEIKRHWVQSLKKKTESKSQPAQGKRDVPGPLLGLLALGRQSVNNGVLFQEVLRAVILKLD